MSTTCAICGHVSADDARFCASCGARLEFDSDAPTEILSPVEAAQAQVSSYGGSAALVVTSGHRSGTRFDLLGDKITVGRHPDSDIFLDDITVSRRHVVIELGPIGHTMTDVGSLNGTYLNGSRIDGTVNLRAGDELQVGKFKLLYVVSPDGQ